MLLKNNRSNVEIADQCCYALANLAVSSHTNSQAMIDGNAIDEIIRIMSMHSRDVQLLEVAAAAAPASAPSVFIIVMIISTDFANGQRHRSRPRSS